MSDEEYCAFNRLITQELTRLLKTDGNCKDCNKRLNPDTTAPCYHPAQTIQTNTDTEQQGNLGQQVRDNTNNQDRISNQDQQKQRPGSPDPVDLDTRGNQVEPENDELWEPEDLEQSHQH